MKPLTLRQQTRKWQNERQAFLDLEAAEKRLIETLHKANALGIRATCNRKKAGTYYVPSILVNLTTK